MRRWFSKPRVDKPGNHITTEARDFPEWLALLSGPRDAKIDIVFIHDITEARDEACRSVGSTNFWLSHLPPDKVDNARIHAFGYDASGVKDLRDLLDEERLKRCAEALLRVYPLLEASEPFISSLKGKEVEHRSGAPVRSTLPTEEESIDNRVPVNIARPTVFVAHGFGGLIYEQALTLAYGSGDTRGYGRKHAAILFNTPHHGAGMAEWAIMCAKQLGIRCADTAQKEDWSGFKGSLSKIGTMQDHFRNIRKKVKVNIAGCYAIRPVPNSNLSLAPEWAVLPDFHPIAVDKSHFGMTRLNREDPAFQRIAKTLDSWTKELYNSSDSPRWMPAIAELEHLSEGFEKMYNLVESHLAIYRPELSEKLACCGNQLEILRALLIRHIFRKGPEELSKTDQTLVEDLKQTIQKFAEETKEHAARNSTEAKELVDCLQKGIWPYLEKEVSHHVRVLGESLPELQRPNTGMAESLQFQGGILQNIHEGSTYRIYAPASEFMSVDDRNLDRDEIDSDMGNLICAVAKVTKVSLNRSEARLLSVPTSGKIEAGWKAKLQSVPIKGVFQVGLSESIKPPINDELQQACYTGSGGPRARMEFITRDDSHQPMFWFEEGSSDRFELQNAAGFITLNLDLSPKELVRTCDHLNRFQMVQNLENTNESSKLQGFHFHVNAKKLTIHQSIHYNSKWGESDEIRVERGGDLDLDVENTGDKEVSFTILDLQPFFGMKIVGSGTLGSGEKTKLKWKAKELPLNEDKTLREESSLNILQAIATTEMEKDWKLPRLRPIDEANAFWILRARYEEGIDLKVCDRSKVEWGNWITKTYKVRMVWA